MYCTRNSQIMIMAIGLMLIVGAFHTSRAATLGEMESLRGLPGIVLKPLTFIATPAKVKHELPLLELTTEIESTLRQSGILLDNHVTERGSEQPFLEIQGAVTQIAANYYAYTILVELHQTATLLSNSSRPLVVTWSEGSLSTGDIRNFQERIQLLVRMFIQDFQKMNASRSPAWSLSWTPSS